MRFSRNWLAECVELPETFEALAEGLTSAGLAVEGTEEVGDDIYFEVDVTSNRPDCMHHLGLAREVAAVFGTPIKEPEVPAPGAVKIEENSWGSIAIEDLSGCSRYVGVVVRGIEVGASPEWLETRLESVGVRSINNVVDVTNFVLWELGQPLHAFDADKLRGAKIIVRSAWEEEALTTLDGEQRRLDPDTLVIADGEGAVALAGIMGGADSEVGAGTTNVLIESACFEPTRVRNGSKKLGLHTDASHRFERGSDPEACLEAALRAAALIRELCGGELDPEAIDVRPGVSEPLEGELALTELCRFAGAEIGQDFVVERLERLGFTLRPLFGDDPAWTVQVPSWRKHDFETDPHGRVYPAYFYEEVLRMYGLDRIASTLPAIEGPDAGAGRSHRRRESQRRFLTAAGLAETVTYSFGPASADGRFENLVPGPPLELANALSEQYSHMRRSLLPDLVEGALFNLRRGARSVRLFEFAHLFPSSGEELETLGIVLGGSLGSQWRREVEMDLFDLKGVLEGLAREFDVLLEFEPRTVKGLLPGTSAGIRLRLSPGDEGEPIGYLGAIDEPESPVALYGVELAVEGFERRSADQVVPPSRHPGVAVDLTLTHSVDTPWADIAEAIADCGARELSSYEMTDRYGGAGVPSGSINTTIAFRYSSDERSLTQDEVNTLHESMTVALKKRFTAAG